MGNASNDIERLQGYAEQLGEPSVTLVATIYSPDRRRRVDYVKYGGSLKFQALFLDGELLKRNAVWFPAVTFSEDSRQMAFEYEALVDPTRYDPDTGLVYFGPDTKPPCIYVGTDTGRTFGPYRKVEKVLLGSQGTVRIFTDEGVIDHKP